MKSRKNVIPPYWTSGQYFKTILNFHHIFYLCLSHELKQIARDWVPFKNVQWPVSEGIEDKIGRDGHEQRIQKNITRIFVVNVTCEARQKAQYDMSYIIVYKTYNCWNFLLQS